MSLSNYSIAIGLAVGIPIALAGLVGLAIVALCWFRRDKRVGAADVIELPNVRAADAYDDVVAVREVATS